MAPGANPHNSYRPNSSARTCLSNGPPRNCPQTKAPLNGRSPCGVRSTTVPIREVRTGGAIGGVGLGDGAGVGVGPFGEPHPVPSAQITTVIGSTLPAIPRRVTLFGPLIHKKRSLREGPTGHAVRPDASGRIVEVGSCVPRSKHLHSPMLPWTQRLS